MAFPNRDPVCVIALLQLSVTLRRFCLAIVAVYHTQEARAPSASI